VTTVEIKDVEIPERMQHAIARQAEAERERRAKIINSEGEFQAAARLAQAGEVIGANPVTLQLRYLQTLREIGGSQNSTVVFPMPIDLVKPVVDAAGGMIAAAQAADKEQLPAAGQGDNGLGELAQGGSGPALESPKDGPSLNEVSPAAKEGVSEVPAPGADRQRSAPDAE
jgi:hypothetical protein